MSKPMDMEKAEQADRLARQILDFARNNLFMHLRFMKTALGRCDIVPYHGTISTDSVNFYYNPEYILKLFQENQQSITRNYLHMTLHCIFQHQFVGSAIRVPVWNLACDIAVEQMIRELHLQNLDDSMEMKQDPVLEDLKKNLKYLTAEKIYDYLMEREITDEQCQNLAKLFSEDNHDTWYAEPDVIEELSTAQSYMRTKNSSLLPNEGEEINDEELPPVRQKIREDARETWRKLSQQIQTDLETFSKQQGDQAGNMMQNLRAVNRERCNYAEFLRKFSVYGEVMKIDEDSFDYNFYCYGMNVYEEIDMALIEPLEYKDAKRVREFVIAIDTSGSVSGKTVQMFIQKTYNILKQQESFFSKVNIHIIQCDTVIQEDCKITNQDEFDEYLKHMKLKGFGGTDFRPVFSYVNDLIEKKEFTNLKGMLYFTDGYGTFPEHEPEYKTAFVFLDDEYNNYNVPVWAIRVILTTEDIMEK